MAQICKGICLQLKAPPIANGLKYESGYKLCSLCVEYFEIDDYCCPCCKTRLRNKPRSRKNKN